MNSKCFVKKSPTNNEILYKVKNYSKDEVSCIISKARKAYYIWRKMTFSERIERFRALLNIIIDRKEEIVNCICTDIGKPYVEAETEVIESCDIISFYLEQNYENLLSLKEIKLDNNLWSDKQSFLKYEPIGVYAVIKPWNYPFELPLWSLVSILLAGNTVVFKPSEYSTKTGILLYEMFLKANFPDGVINLITGDGTVGELIVNDINIDAIDFTGSQSVGKKIYNTNTERIKKLNLELGGSDFAIVFNDADIDLTVDGLLWGAFTNSGQVCVSTEKILVNKSVYNMFKAKYIEKVKKLKINKEIGPIISEEKLVNTLNLINDSVANGCKILFGGRKVDEISFSKGNYMYPTVIECNKNYLLNTLPELFAPVVYICEFDDNDEVVDIINKSSFGLGCTVWSKSIDVFERISNDINCGMIWFNEVNLPLPQVPWIGIKDSGTGFSLSIDSIKNSMNIKVINLDTSYIKRDWWYPYE